VVGANTNESTETKEKSKGFFSKKESHLMAINQKVISSNLNAGDISLKAGGNLALVSSNLNANNINLNADENVIVDANHNVEASQSFTKSSRFSLKPTSLYESNLHLLEKGDRRAVASNLNANENININASNISLKGANLNSQKDINLNANSIDISNTNDESYRNEVSKKSKIGLISIGEHIKNLKADLIQKLNPIKDLKAKTKDTSIKVPIAKASLDQKSSKENWVNANSSNLNANGDINLNAKDDINIVGSNLNANEAINLTSQNSNIKHSTNLYAKDTSSKEATGTLSITAQNEYAQIVPAALALKEAIAQLKRVKKEYDNYKKEKSKLEASLSDIKQRYRNKEVGIDYSDIEEVSEILEEYRDEEKYFKENILLATENVNAKNLALITQMAAALASSGTYGFSVGVRADLATTKQESSLKQTSSNKSSLNAKHININSAKDISITGSDLASKEDTSLNSNNLNINSSEDSLKYKSNTKSLTTGFGFTFYGANSSSLELGTNSLKQSEQSLINNNSHLYSAKDMNINTANDATIKGANLRADERLNLKVGNNLSLESTRDIKDASSKSKGINLSVSYSGATNAKNFASGDRSLSSVGASISKSNSNTKIKQTNLSSITANELNVEVGKNTHLKGSLLAAGEYDKDNTFIDNHNLNLKTNTLSYENLSNTSYNKGSSLSIGANYSVGKKDDSKVSQSDQGKSGSSYSGLKSINYSNQRNLSYTLSKNLATLGSGNIEIADKDNSDDLTRLNRDTTKLTKDLVNTSISSNVDASMDARVLTADGREQIKSEIKHIIDKLDDFNRFVKDKISDELTNEQKEQIGKVGLENSILQALKKEGVSDEKINLLLNDENVRRLISDYENINNVNTSKPNNTNTHKLNNEIILKGIEVVAQKDLQDYLVDGAEAINSMVKIIGEEKAATAILITQFATQGIVKTSVSMLMEEGKDTLFGGVKDKISNYISKDLFEVNDKGWQDKQKEAIYSLSDVSADFSIDLAISGPFALMKGAKNLGKANKKFDESLKENNVNSDTIANSNAELKSNEHNLNNKNSSDGVGKNGIAGIENTIKNSGKKIVKDTVENNAKKQITNDAYEIAKSGGKNSGFYKNYLDKSTKEIEKGIKSLEKQIQEHADKISNPQKYIKDFDKLDIRQQENLINKKWNSDIARQKEQKQILEQILQERIK
ncbi:hemagglutinin repeat-containing protein, partial [Campylobacter concisus]